jgi:hypothetical protein
MNYPLAQSALALAASLALAGAALGQSSSGGISGRVLDASFAPQVCVERYPPQSMASTGFSLSGTHLPPFGRGPGLNNFNVSLFKNLIVGEKFRFQLRAEAYNSFNHTQFNAVNVAAK